MTVDIHTLALVLGFTNLLQVMVLFVQYRVNPGYRGPGWWALGSVSLALGSACNAVQDNSMVGSFAIVISNALFISGLALLCIGVLRFLDQRERRGRILGLCAVTILVAIYFTCLDDNLTARRVNLSVVMAAISFVIARSLLVHRTAAIATSANFLAAVFLANGGFWAVCGLSPLVGPVGDLFSASTLPTTTYLAMASSAMLWTFGFIILINQRLNTEYREAKENSEQIFNTSPDAVLITRLEDGHFQEINDGLTALTGYTRDDVIGKTTMEVQIWENPADRQRLVAMLNEQGSCDNLEAVFQRKDGSRFTGMLSAKLLTLQGAPHIITVTRDITEQKQAEETLRVAMNDLERMASTDVLTGAWNRRQFNDIVEREIHRASRYQEPLSLLLLDIDHFKNVNDTCGHAEGDQVLRQVADCIRGVIRHSDSLTRWGGEEFVVLMPNTGEAHAVILAERIRQRIATHIFQGLPGITVSIGVAEHVGAGSCSAWLERADRAMYLAKKGGRNRVIVDTPEGGVPSLTGRLEGTFLKLVWSPAFLSGNALIDTQHEGLFQRSNELLDAVLSERPVQEISSHVTRLLAEVVQHFQDEERILAEVGFPGLPEHAAKHASLVAQAVALAAAFAVGTLSLGSLFQFLALDVVSLHMLKADKEFFPFTRAGFR